MDLTFREEEVCMELLNDRLVNGFLIRVPSVLDVGESGGVVGEGEGNKKKKRVKMTNGSHHRGDEQGGGNL